MEVYRLRPSDETLIRQIAEWYFHEFSISIQRTIKRLSKINSDDLIFQLLLLKEGQLVSTGGLYHNIGLSNKQLKFKMYGPWISLLFTHPLHRNKGFGTTLLEELENGALLMGFSKLYLHSFTAEHFYKRYGWKETARAAYKGHHTVVMVKDL